MPMHIRPKVEELIDNRVAPPPSPHITSADTIMGGEQKVTVT